MFILSQVRYKTDVKNMTITVRLLVAYYSGEELVQADRLLPPPCILLTSVIIAYAKQLCHPPNRMLENCSRFPDDI